MRGVIRGIGFNREGCKVQNKKVMIVELLGVFKEEEVCIGGRCRLF